MINYKDAQFLTKNSCNYLMDLIEKEVRKQAKFGIYDILFIFPNEYSEESVNITIKQLTDEYGYKVEIRNMSNSGFGRTIRISWE